MVSPASEEREALHPDAGMEMSRSFGAMAEALGNMPVIEQRGKFVMTGDSVLVVYPSSPIPCYDRPDHGFGRKMNGENYTEATEPVLVTSFEVHYRGRYQEGGPGFLFYAVGPTWGVPYEHAPEHSERWRTHYAFSPTEHRLDVQRLAGGPEAKESDRPKDTPLQLSAF